MTIVTFHHLQDVCSLKAHEKRILTFRMIQGECKSKVDARLST